MNISDPEDRKNPSDDEQAFPPPAPDNDEELVEEWEEESFPGSDPPQNY